MASKILGPGDAEDFLKTQMQGISHFINLKIPGLTQKTLLYLLENLEEEVETGDVCPEETVFKLNFKSWVHFKLGDRVKAKEINDSVSKLQEMKGLPNTQKPNDTANAELAYCYSRVGGPVNLFKAIRLFEEVVGRNADQLYWKLRLGLAYKQCTHRNIYTGIPEGPTVLKCVENAAQHLTDVYRNSSAGKLRGPALSELALLCISAPYIIEREDVKRIFREQNPEQMCNEALKYEENSTWVLTNCGKIFRNLKQLDKAVEVFEKSLLLRSHTTIHHQLGLCYATKAQQESTPQTHSKEQEPGQRSHTLSIPSTSEPQKILEKENYRRAEEEYLSSIELSQNRNLPAIYSLGLLYKLAGKYQNALDRFNEITNSEGEGYLATLINAYEQAGLCYQKMEKPEAEEKLTKAISLAVMVASTCPQLQNCAPTEIWQSFRNIRDGLKAVWPLSPTDKKLTQLSKLLKVHKVKVVEEILALSDTELLNPAVIRTRLLDYLQLQETEKAFAFLNMVSMGSNMTNTWGTTEMRDLREKVLLRTAENRLKLQSNDAKCIFQELFRLKYDQCAGCVSEDSVDIPNNRDVLLFYDDDHDTEKRSQTSQTVRDLQTVLSQVFGLDVSMNLQGCLTYGPKMDEQLEEMKKYQVVVVVLGPKTRSAEFQRMMEKIPHMTTTVDPSKKVVVTGACQQETEIPHMTTTVDPAKKVMVIDACQQETEIPEILRHYPCFRLRQQAVGNWGQGEVGAPRREGHIPVKDLTRRDDLMSLMPLFKFVLGIKKLPLH